MLVTYTITYAYVLSEWFETNCKEVIDILREDYKIPILIVQSANFISRVKNIFFTLEM